MSNYIQQAREFCKLHKCTFKIRYETCFDEFTAHIRKIRDEETGQSIPLESIKGRKIGNVNIVIEHEDEIAMSRDKSYEKALLSALEKAHFALKLPLQMRA